MAKKRKLTKGKFIKIGNKNAIYADKNYLIETNENITEHDSLDDLPVKLRKKCKGKEKAIKKEVKIKSKTKSNKSSKNK